jgi:hypothetical protein
MAHSSTDCGPRHANAPPRTNSLAFAKSSCHTCTALKEHCDRRRPRCDICLAQKRICGGFPQDLVWKDPSLRNNVDAPSHLGDVQPESYQSPRLQTQATFKFVQGRAKRKRISKPVEWDMASMRTTFALQSPSTRHVQRPGTVDTAVHSFSSAKTPDIPTEANFRATDRH